MKNNEFEWCQKLFEDIWNWPISGPFRTPVPFSVQDYYKVIKNPMDLETVKFKLEDKIYKSVDDFLCDMRLICTNSKTYNGDDTYYGQMASDILNEINERAAKRADDMEKINLKAIKLAIDNLKDLYKSIPNVVREKEVF